MSASRPLRVACLLPRFPVTSQNFILDQITGLIDRGCEVDLFAHSRGDETALHPDIARYELLERTHFWAPSEPGWRGRLRSALRATQSCKDAGACVSTLRAGDARHVGPLLNLLSGAQALASRRYDVIHVHFGSVATAAVLLRDAIAPGTPVVTTFYGHDVTRLPRDSGPDAYRTLFSRGDHFLALSEDMRARLIALGAPPERVSVHALGVRCDAIPFRERRADSEAPISLSCVARLVEKKGLEFAIRAVAELRERKVDVRLDIYGDGPERLRLAGLIDTLGLGALVTLHGRVGPGEALDAIARAQIFLHPSVVAADGDEEGTPTAILEAMASGSPVVSTRHAGIPEQIEDGRSGVLVPERDSRAIADALEALIGEPRRWAELGRAARRRVEADYDSRRQNDALLALYETLAGATARA